MIYESRLAERVLDLPQSMTHRQLELLEKFHLPTRRHSHWDVEALLEVMYRDKKNLSGQFRFMLPKTLGDMTLVDQVPRDLLVDVLQ
ncbi:MAG: hypothetical protein R3B84_22690 [Zavarzinella sp.]